MAKKKDGKKKKNAEVTAPVASAPVATIPSVDPKRQAMLDRMVKARAARTFNRDNNHSGDDNSEAPKPVKTAGKNPGLTDDAVEARRQMLAERLVKARAARAANRAARQEETTPETPVVAAKPAKKEPMSPEARNAALRERLAKARAAKAAKREDSDATTTDSPTAIAATPRNTKRASRPSTATDELPAVLGIGIIGAGGIARGVHIPGYEKLPNAQVLAVSDPFAGAREGAAQQFNIGDAYEDFREMLKRDDIHAVSVTTPNFLHAEAAIAAMEAGKHVLCEKPLAMNAREGDEMVAVSKRTGCKLMCGFHYRFTPEVQALKRFAEAGSLGEMYYARTQALRRRGIPSWGMFISKEKNGGGPLIDIGVHMLDATMHVLGFPKPIAVSGKTWQMFGKRSDVLGLMGQWDHENFTVEDFAVAQVRFDNGAILTLESSFVANQEESDKMSFQIFGSQGGAQYNPLKMYREENKTLLDITPVHLPRNVQAHHEEIKSFVNSILDDTPVYTPGEEAVEITRIIDAIYESSESGKEVVF